MSVLESGIFTTELTNDSLIITESMGVKEVSIFNASSTSGTVTGSQKLLGTPSSAINVAEAETFTVNALEASVIKNLSIVSPAGCTLKIVAIV